MAGWVGGYVIFEMISVSDRSQNSRKGEGIGVCFLLDSPRERGIQRQMQRKAKGIRLHLQKE